MLFEYDINKSNANKDKHGIDFIEAQALWEDENLLIVPLIFLDEERFLYIGKIKSKLWSAVVTCRCDKTRFISVRRSRKKERIAYESE